MATCCSRDSQRCCAMARESCRAVQRSRSSAVCPVRATSSSSLRCNTCATVCGKKAARIKVPLAGSSSQARRQHRYLKVCNG